MKVFEQKVEKISRSAAYLEAEAAHERLKVKGDLDEEEKLEKHRLEDVMKEQIAIEERLQTEATIVAIRSGMEVSHYTLFRLISFRNGSERIK